MAHVPADGVLGLEGRHELKGGDQMPPGAGNEYSVFMYGRMRPDLGSSWTKIDRITGLHSLGDADDPREPAEGRIGEVIYPAEERGKTFVYEGRHVGTTLKNERQRSTTFRRAARESRRRRNGSMTVVHPADTSVGYGTGIRVMAYDQDEEQTRTQHAVYPWQREFVMAVRAHDPRWVWYPIEDELANAAGATVVLNNQGNAEADLKFTIRATADPLSVVVENLTLGTKLKFDLMPMPGGIDRRLRIDWPQRAAVRPDALEPNNNPNTDMMPYLDHAASDWWNAGESGLGPGNNSIKVSGTNVGTWDVEFQHSTE